MICDVVPFFPPEDRMNSCFDALVVVEISHDTKGQASINVFANIGGLVVEKSSSVQYLDSVFLE